MLPQKNLWVLELESPRPKTQKGRENGREVTEDWSSGHRRRYEFEKKRTEETETLQRMLTVCLLPQSLHSTRDKLGASPMTHCMDGQEDT